jgi:tetratricopeptide (TPR) repeat protein
MRIIVAIVILVAAAAAPAFADNAKADELFKKGKKLLAEGKYAEACKAFEGSQRAEPTIGTLLNVAKCYEEWGKLATAYETYAEAQRQADEAGDDRAERIKERVETIEPTVPTLVIRADSKPVDLVVKLDGKELAIGELNQPRRLNPGEHVIEYGIADGDKKRITIELEPNDHKTTTLEKLAAMQVGGPVEEALEPDEEEPVEVDDPNKGRTRRILGIVTAGTGVLAIGISSWLVLDARADYRAALAAHCNADKECDDIGLDQTRDARSRANIGTVVFSVGLAAVAGGAILWFTAPRPATTERARIQPVVTPDGAGVVVSGSF